MVLTFTLSCVSWSSNFRKTRKSNSFIYTGALKAVVSDTKETAHPSASLMTLKVWAFPRSSSVTPLEDKAIPHG